MNPSIIRKTALAVFRNGKMIMARPHKNEEVFLTLSGKIEAGESDTDCLHREALEEAGATIKEGSFKFLQVFEAPAYGKENTLVNIRLYQGELVSSPVPSSEIAELRYFDSTVDKKHLTEITIEMFAWLKKNDLIR